MCWTGILVSLWGFSAICVATYAPENTGNSHFLEIVLREYLYNLWELFYLLLTWMETFVFYVFQGFTKEITMEKDRWQGYGLCHASNLLKFNRVYYVFKLIFTMPIVFFCHSMYENCFICILMHIAVHCYMLVFSLIEMSIYKISVSNPRMWFQHFVISVSIFLIT